MSCEQNQQGVPPLKSLTSSDWNSISLKPMTPASVWLHSLSLRRSVLCLTKDFMFSSNACIFYLKGLHVGKRHYSEIWIRISKKQEPSAKLMGIHSCEAEATFLIHPSEPEEEQCWRRVVRPHLWVCLEQASLPRFGGLCSEKELNTPLAPSSLQLQAGMPFSQSFPAPLVCSCLLGQRRHHLLVPLESEQLQASADVQRVGGGRGGGEQAWSDQSSPTRLIGTLELNLLNYMSW